MFAGKWAFSSAVPGGANLYLGIYYAVVGSKPEYWPGMKSSVVSESEKFSLYQRLDGYFNVQSGPLFPQRGSGSRTLLWLSRAGSVLAFTEDPALAASFALSGEPHGSQLSLHTDGGDLALFYAHSSEPGVKNLLYLAPGEGLSSTFAPVRVTPGLDALRQHKKGAGVDLSDVDLTGQDLSGGIDFTGADFRYAQLAGTDFSGATLDGADLSQTDVRGLNWGRPASAVGVNLSRSNASKCVLGLPGLSGHTIDCTGANFSGANLTGARLDGLTLKNASLRDSILTGAVLDGCVLDGVVLDSVVGPGASFADASLTGASIQMSVLINAVFDRADLSDARLTANPFLFMLSSQVVVELDGAAFPTQGLQDLFSAEKVPLQPRDVVTTVLVGKEWHIAGQGTAYKLSLTSDGSAVEVRNANANLIPTVLSAASLIRTNATGAQLAGADVRGVLLQGACLASADLQDADFSGASMMSADLSQANVSGTNFSQAVLLQADFTGCVAKPGGSQRGTSFEGAHVEGADFSKATFSGAILTGALVSLDLGVPLFCLDVNDQMQLTDAAVTTLTPKFAAAHIDLGASPRVVDSPYIVIDNSGCQDSVAPRVYRADTRRAPIIGIETANGTPIFSLPASDAALVAEPQASADLVAAFAAQHYTLAPGAPLRRGWVITPSADAAYRRPYRFQSLLVQLEANRLVVHGLWFLTFQVESEDPPVAFSPTLNLSAAMSGNSIGPAGLPFSWLEAEELDQVTFFSAALPGRA